MRPDSWSAILADASAKVTAGAKKAADAVRPHVTLDNALKVAGVVNGALDVAVKVRQIRPPGGKP